MPIESETLPAEVADLALIRIACDLSLMAWEQMRAFRPLLGASLDARVVDTKTSPNDLVTQADAQIEALVRGYLSQVRPNDLMVGEEGSPALDPVEFYSAEILGRLHAFDASTGGLVDLSDSGPSLEWHVDPIDGTVNFVRGIEHHAFSVGVCEGSASDGGLGLGRWLIGLVASPGLDATWLAADGLGSYRVDGRLADQFTAVSDSTAVSDALPSVGAEDGQAPPSVGAEDGQAPAGIPARRLHGTPAGLSGRLLATGFAYTGDNRGPQLAKLENLMDGYDDLRRCGSAAIDLCMVAEGRINSYAERGLGIYDYAGGAVIVEEAGLLVSRGGSGGPTAAADSQEEVDRLVAAI
ncbi:inositol monophosphatase family protein [Brevibacterium oceani]|uniref:inositol monophosphatase family protein n=1 Tax=Brevibacterium oceani TaxID=358099 RepID=UPI001B3245F0|nr:inositol monophosphatase family protein [Brevibacterium oceani]